MYLDIALLIDQETQNSIRKLILKLHIEYGLELVAALLPQHISLKSSFTLKNIDEIETYFDNLAVSLEPVDFKLQNIELINFEKKGIMNEVIWIDVEENSDLRNIHKKVNRDLKDKFDIPLSPFDGDMFHFHSTLFYRFNNQTPMEIYEKAFQDLKEKHIGSNCRSSEIALFCSPMQREKIFGTSIVYKVLPLGM